MKLRYLTLIFGLFIITESCNKKTSIILVKGITIDSASQNNTSRSTRVDIFLVKNYHNDPSGEKYVDNYVSNNSNARSHYMQYHMLFLKESKKSTVESLRASLKQAGKSISNEEDFIFDYGWGEFGKVFKKEKTEKLETPKSNFKIENVPTSDSSK